MSHSTCDFRESKSLTIDLSLMPLLEPSYTGFTINGKFKSLISIRCGSLTSTNLGVGIPSDNRIFLVNTLSSVRPNVSPSEPTNGIRSISNITGICDSRLRPSNPSDILKTMSTQRFSSCPSKLWTLPILITLCPLDSNALVIISTVSSWSNSALASIGSPGMGTWSRFKSYVRPIIKPLSS